MDDLCNAGVFSALLSCRYNDLNDCPFSKSLLKTFSYLIGKTFLLSVLFFCFVFSPCVRLKNEKGQCPADVVPDPLDMPLDMADAAAMAKELRTLLRQALPRPSSPLPLTLKAQSLPALSDKARLQLASMGIRLGDRVIIAAQKVSCGSEQRSSLLYSSTFSLT